MAWRRSIAWYNPVRPGRGLRASIPPGDGLWSRTGTTMIKRARQRQADRTSDAAPVEASAWTAEIIEGVLAALRSFVATRRGSTASRRTRSGPWSAMRSLDPGGRSEVRLGPACREACEPTKWPNYSALGAARVSRGPDGSFVEPLGVDTDSPGQTEVAFPGHRPKSEKARPLARTGPVSRVLRVTETDIPCLNAAVPAWAEVAVPPRRAQLTRVWGDGISDTLQS